MSSISSINNEINSCRNKISQNNKIIDECVNSHDSLNLFKRSVEESKEEHFQNAKDIKSIVQELNPLTEECITAKRYMDGMEDTVSGIGYNIVGVAYTTLIASVNIKLAAYRTQIKLKEVENNVLEGRIRNLEMKKDAIRAAERAAEAMKNLLTD